MFSTLLHISAALLAAQLVRSISIIDMLIVCVLALLPDIDTPKSLIGKLLPTVSIYLERKFGHRTLTHSIFAVAVIAITENALTSHTGIFTAAYASHILIDLIIGLNGVALLYPIDKNPLTIAAYADDGRAPRVLFMLCASVAAVLALLPLAQLSAVAATQARDVGAFKALPTAAPVPGTLIFIRNATERRIDVGDFVKKGQILGISNINGVAVAVRAQYSGFVSAIEVYQDQNELGFRVYIDRVDDDEPAKIDMCGNYYGFMFIGNCDATPPAAVISGAIVTPTRTHTSSTSSPTPYMAVSTVAPPNNLPAGERCTVNHVSDGDTIKCQISGKNETIRLIGIDTPESVKPGTDIQCGALDASAFTKKMLMNVVVVLDKDKSERDRYGRLLRYVWLPDGTMFNEVLVSQGLAKAYKYPPDTRETTRFNAAQTHAQAVKLGIWGACVK